MDSVSDFVVINRSIEGVKDLVVDRNGFSLQEDERRVRDGCVENGRVTVNARGRGIRHHQYASPWELEE